MEKIKILMIDDEIDFGKITKMNLELGEKAFEVQLATSGKEGLKLTTKIMPDLILLDIIMPQMDGFEVLKKLKADEKTATIPVIMLTAKTDEESMLKASQLYDEAYVTKPIEAPDLSKKIMDVLKRTGSQKVQ
jgi:DNA-binding response OmpR family regulator